MKNGEVKGKERPSKRCPLGTLYNKEKSTGEESTFIVPACFAKECGFGVYDEASGEWVCSVFMLQKRLFNLSVTLEFFFQVYRDK